jgi:arsenate reductase
MAIELKNILFVCVENAGRSQIAEAFAKKYGAGKVVASSAGNKPAEKINPTVVEAMAERGIDISKNTPRLITAKMAKEADLVVTMGCSAQGVCPGPFFVPTIDWPLEDPKGKPVEKVREIRDNIEEQVKQLITNLTT